MNNPCIYEKTLIEKQDLGLYSGDIATFPDKLDGHPKLNWSGSIIDITQFRIALAFLKWTHEEHKVEGQIRLFYNEFTREWKTVALPQYIWSAGHTREVEEDNPIKSKIIDELLNAGFGQAGTGHHHSNMGAFQSGGDKEDELGQAGFHFTVGHMSKDVADFHCRATFRKINYDPAHNMLNPNQWVPGLHNHYVQDEEKEIFALWLDLKNLPAFPEIWKTYLVEKPKPAVIQSPWSNRYNRSTKTSKTTYSTAPIFRDKFFCIYPKPHTVNLGAFHRFHIIPKTPSTSQTAAAITTTIDTKPLKPKLTQAELNQQHLEELESKTQNELLDKLKRINEEFNDVCLKLRAELSPSTNSNTPSGRVNARLQECLVEFRDSHIPDSYSGKEISDICGILQEMSTAIINEIQITIDTYSRHITWHSPEELENLLITWGTALFDQILIEATPNELAAIHEECLHEPYTNIDFYETMCVGLKRAAFQGTVDPIYETDGSLKVEIV